MLLYQKYKKRNASRGFKLFDDNYYITNDGLKEGFMTLNDFWMMRPTHPVYWPWYI